MMQRIQRDRANGRRALTMHMPADGPQRASPNSGSRELEFRFAPRSTFRQPSARMRASEFRACPTQSCRGLSCHRRSRDTSVFRFPPSKLPDHPCRGNRSSFANTALQNPRPRTDGSEALPRRGWPGASQDESAITAAKLRTARFIDLPPPDVLRSIQVLRYPCELPKVQAAGFRCAPDARQPVRRQARIPSGRARTRANRSAGSSPG